MSTSTAEPTTRLASARRPRRLHRKVALALAVFGLGLLVAEIALRLWAAFKNPPPYMLDAHLGWKHTPSIDRLLDDGTGRMVRFATDDRGLRATPHARAQTPGHRRVLFVGDSFTQGSQVEADELFTTRVERALTDVEVWNAGVGGYSTLQELRAMAPQLAAFAPDLMVLMVFENDFQDNLMPYFSGLGPRPCARVAGSTIEIVDPPDPAPFTRFLMPAPGALWLYDHCALYRALHKHLFLPLHWRELAALEQAEREALAEADEHAAMAWLLEQVAATVRAAKCELLVAAIPLSEAVRAGDAPSHAWLGARCAELHVPFVSLLAPLQKATADRAYFAKDIHLTATGHAAVADALAPAIDSALRRRQ